MAHSKPRAVVIRLSALGDILLTAPMVQHHWLTHDVIFVTSPAYGNLVAHLAGVSEVQILDKKKGREGQSNWPLLNETPIDYVDRPTTQNENSFVFTPVACQKTCVLSKRTFGQGLQALFGRDVVLNETHQAKRYLSVLSSSEALIDPVFLNGMPATWAAEASAFLDNVLAKTNQPKIGFAYAATHATKGWSPAQIVETIPKKDGEINWVLVGGPSDNEQLNVLTQMGLPAHIPNTCSLSLEALAGVLEQLDLLIGVDTGPIHLARMLKTPTLDSLWAYLMNRWGPGHFACQPSDAVCADGLSTL